ncbi:MAG: AAA family ATPase [Anaerolineales bacterium]|jgi:CO dehydrogenase maturation factor
MTTTIALCGKGGTGKTTIAALLIRSLVRRINGPLLAIDADPAANLHLALGLPMPASVGDIREDMMDHEIAAQLGVAISRHDYLTREVRMALEEGQEVDLLAMGRPEGQGCYCSVNHLLRQIVDELGRSYPFVVIDNEAGMEHISRRTTKDVDLLLIVTDPSIRGLTAAASIASLAKEIEVNVRRQMLIVNRLHGELTEPLRQAIDELGIEVGPLIPADAEIGKLDSLGKPLLHLDGDSSAVKAVEEIASVILKA